MLSWADHVFRDIHFGRHFLMFLLDVYFGRDFGPNFPLSLLGKTFGWQILNIIFKRFFGHHLWTSLSYIENDKKIIQVKKN